MDLQEKVDLQSKRHPWEKVRAKFIQKILLEFAPDSFRVLDVGCGDGYIASRLAENFSHTEYIGLDTNLTSAQLDFYNTKNPQVKFTKNNKYLAEKQFDLVLLLDVLEHIEDDEKFIMQIVSKYLAKKSRMLITVPAFPFLYGSHDSIMGHYRRYTQNQLKNMAQNANCKTIATGYMFASLVPMRAISILLQRLSLIKKPDYSGVGQWNGSNLFSKLIEYALTIDNQILFSASKSGYLIPGLSLWLLCEKRQ
ncbi:class I SAM-dependent methyltransferase [Thermodesulfobacteriota bacterium]